MEISKLSKSVAINDLNRLAGKGLINKEGEPKATIYTITEKGKSIIQE